MDQWILDTYNDSFPEQKYAFLGTVNWMKALGIYIEQTDFDKKIESTYQNIERAQKDKQRDLKVFENLLMSYHNHASLRALSQSGLNPYDISRIAIVSWYYSIYFGGSAMIAALMGESYDTHTKTADVWLKNLIPPKLILPPFNFHLNSLVQTDVDTSITELREGNTHLLWKTPFNLNDARGAILSYLKGSAKFERTKVEEKLLSSKEFKRHELSDFRKKIAQEKRDEQLAKKGVSFLHQAFRYRGKVNYRDSLFLTYGEVHTKMVEQLLKDLFIVSGGFQKMCIRYIKVRLPKESWSLFEQDLNKNTRLSLKFNYWDKINY